MSSELIARYATATTELIDFANSLTREELELPGKDGEWSRAFIIHHMADGDIHFAARYWYVLAVVKPMLANFDEELYPVNLNYAHRDPFASLAAIEGLFQVNLDVLSAATDSQWNRIGVREGALELTLTQIFTQATEHREGHLNQLRGEF